MAPGDLGLTECAAATIGCHFRPGPGMDFGGAAAAVAIAGQMMRHPLFDGAALCHCVSSGCLAAAPPGHLAAVRGRIC